MKRQVTDKNGIPTNDDAIKDQRTQDKNARRGALKSTFRWIISPGFFNTNGPNPYSRQIEAAQALKRQWDEARAIKAARQHAVAKRTFQEACAHYDLDVYDLRKRYRLSVFSGYAFLVAGIALLFLLEEAYHYGNQSSFVLLRMMAGSGMLMSLAIGLGSFVLFSLAARNFYLAQIIYHRRIFPLRDYLSRPTLWIPYPYFNTETGMELHDGK